MKALSRPSLVFGIALLLLTCVPNGLAQGTEAQKLQCDAQLDSKKKHTVMLLVDASDVPAMKLIIKATITVGFVGADGKKLGSQKFTFVDSSQQPLLPGKTYSRR